MPREFPGIDFRNIRAHLTSQQRGFEELCFQLVPALELLGRGVELNRRGNPDAGIEFWCESPNGDGKWAWQAKFLFDLDATTFQQMSRSVEDALLTTPDLRRYTFLLPANLSGRSGPQRRSGERRWETHVSDWQDTARNGGLDVEFRFRGHSDLLSVLLDGLHDGAVRYWFDVPLLGSQFFLERATAAIENLRQRYRPALNVDLEIAERLHATCLSDGWLAKVNDAHRRISSEGLSGDNFDEPLSSQVATAARSTLGALALASERLDHLQDPTSTALAECELAFRLALRDVEAAENTASATRPPHEGHQTDASRRHHRVEEHLWGLRNRLSTLVELLADPTAKEGLLLVVGKAGSGKSHLLADVVRHRVEAGVPGVLLLGQHFDNADVWSQIAVTLGIDLPRDDLLALLSTAAETIHQGRCLIAIDALNERYGAGTWRGQLPGLLADVSRYPWLALVVSVRDTYESEITGGLALPRVTHPGFDGHEEEALERFSTHYSLRLNDLPPLLPELTNPLFLIAICEALQAEGLSQLPRDRLGIAWVFDGWIDALEKRLSDRLDFAAPEHPVRRAVDLLASLLLDSPQDAIPWSNANTVCNQILPRDGRRQSLLSGLIEEGILIHDADPSGEVIRFTYQRVADFRMATALMERHPNIDALRSAVGDLIGGDRPWRWRGLLEALSVIVPESMGQELIDVVGQGQDPRSGRRIQLSLAGQQIASLEWRSTRSITDRTVELAHELVRNRHVSDDEWFAVLVRLACVPGHPLNIQYLGTRLQRMSLSDRDLAWSYELLGGTARDAVERTLSWSLHHGDSSSSEVAALAARFVAWLFTSPNRSIRDRATKGLVRVLEHHPSLWPPFVNEFLLSNDPYVVERVLSASMGWVLRHRLDAAPPLDVFDALSAAVYENLFAAAVPRHLMIRHYARTIIEVCDDLLERDGRSPQRDRERVRPPYSSTWPVRAQTNEQLERRAGADGRFALINEFDDFYRYTIEGAIRSLAPHQTDRQLADERRRWRQNLAATEAAVDAAVAAWFAADPTVPEILATGQIRELDVPREVESALADLRTEERRREPPRVSADVVARAVSQRVLGLGWTHDRFGLVDRSLSRGRYRIGESSERFGKKYAWVALYEVLGQLTDHSDLQEPYRDTAGRPYDGPWGLGYMPDIDPSHVVVAHAPRDGEGASLAWWRQGFTAELDPDPSDQLWLQHGRDLPDWGRMLVATDPHGDLWLALAAHGRWKRTHSRRPGMARDAHRSLWIRSQAHIVHQDGVERMRRWSSGKNWMGLWMPMPPDYSDAYLGTYPDLAPWPPMMQLHGDESNASDGWHRLTRERLRVRQADTIASYNFDRDRDFSSREVSTSADLPSPKVLQLLDARWTPNSRQATELGLGRNERESAWSAGDRLVAFYAAGEHHGHGTALFVRLDPLLEALERDHLAIWAWVLGEKGYANGWDWSRERAELFAAGTWERHGWQEWSATFEYVNYETQLRRTLVSRRPRGGAATRPVGIT